LVDISNINAGNLSGSIQKASAVSVPVKAEVALPSLQRARAADVAVPIDLPQTSAKGEEERFIEVKIASLAVLTNPYPISDKRFAIFKDLAGDYVTRFTSLVDGSVQYFPEKTLFEFVKVLQIKASGAGLNTEA
jgi:hypothetical protein